MSTKSLQIISNIHLENYNYPINFSNFLIPSSPNLALCGNIGYPYFLSYKDFLKWCSSKFEKIFIITGNSDYYQIYNNNNMYNTIHKKKLTIQDTDDLIKTIILEFPNITFLQNNIFELYDKIILGTTLWTDINILKSIIVQHSIRDYKFIYKSHDNRNTINNNKFIYSVISPRDTTKLHIENVKWLKKTIDQYKNKDIIILSYYLPSFKLLKESSLNICFATDLEYLISDNIKYWICGCNNNVNNTIETINNCKIIVNSFNNINSNNYIINL